MTATNELRLDAPIHYRMPDDQQGADEYFIEQLIRHHVDTRESWALNLIRHYRRDLTPQQFDDALAELCRLNSEAVDYGMTGQTRAQEVALDEYASALAAFAGGDFDSHARSAIAVVDELAAPRARKGGR
jgi:hypothetical protein